MTAVTLAIEGAELLCRALHGTEELGRATAVAVTVFSKEPVAPADLVGKPAALCITTAFGERVMLLIVKRARLSATTDADQRRELVLDLASPMSTLALARRSRIFRDQNLPDILSKVLEQHGGTVAQKLSEDHGPLPYVVQYEETDETFVRRMCERAGIFIREQSTDSELTHELRDRSPDAPTCLPSPLALADDSGLREARACAWHLEADRRRTVGAVRVRDYNADTPAVDIEAVKKGGSDHEQSIACYEAPIGAKDAAQAGVIGERVLQALQARAMLYRFVTNAPECAVGSLANVEQAGARGSAAAPGEVFITAVEHRFGEEGAGYEAAVTAIPKATPFRLPRVTPRPVLPGVSSAMVTGAAGEEIHCDDAGRVRLRYAWDREAPTDDKSSPPVRVMHPQLAGSLLTPRVGWEVWTAFEDGDPERPFVVGRADNGKNPPPLGLPENKTCTRMASPASPGGGAINAITMQDGAGALGLVIDAGGCLTTHVAGNAGMETVAADTHKIGGAHTVSCAKHDLKVGAAFVTDVASQLITAAHHDVKTPEAQDVKVGSEAVTCASLSELVGSPGGAVLSIAEGAVSAGTGFLPGGKLKTAVEAAQKAYGVGKEVYGKGAGSGLVAGAKVGAGMLPGADKIGLVMDMAEGAEVAPWQPGKQPWQVSEERWKRDEKEASEAFNAVVGGAGVGAPAPGAAGGGERVTKTGSSYSESIGAVYALISFATYKHTTLGARLCMIGGAHATASGKYDSKTLGSASVTTGAFSVKAAKIDRAAKSIFSVTTGPLRHSGNAIVFNSSGVLHLTAGAINVSGAKLIFQVGGSKVVIDGSGMTIKSPVITYASTTNAKEGSRG